MAYRHASLPLLTDDQASSRDDVSAGWDRFVLSVMENVSGTVDDAQAVLLYRVLRIS